MTEEMPEFVCALSGRAATESELVRDVEDDDPFGEMPMGWVRLRVTRRMPNPSYLQIVEAKEAAIAGQLAQIPAGTPDADRHAAETILRIVVDAQFHAMLSDTERFIYVEQDVYISDPSKYGDVKAAWAEIGKALGLDLE